MKLKITIIALIVCLIIAPIIIAIVNVHNNLNPPVSDGVPVETETSSDVGGDNKTIIETEGKTDG